MAFYQPMTLLEMVVYYNEKKDIQRISEVKFDVLLNSIPFNIKKSTIAMFVSEILMKCLMEEKEPIVFNYCFDFVEQLEKKEFDFENYHLIFLLGLGQILGVVPDTLELFGKEHELHGTPDDMNSLGQLFSLDYSQQISINNSLRRQMLERILDCYASQFSAIQDLKSLPVIREILT